MAPRKPVEGNTTMADEAAATTAPKKRRAPQGPRTPSPMYAFATVTGGDGNPVAGATVKLAKTFRDPRKMAAYMNEAMQKGEQLLVITPEV